MEKLLLGWYYFENDFLNRSVYRIVSIDISKNQVMVDGVNNRSKILSYTEIMKSFKRNEYIYLKDIISHELLMSLGFKNCWVSEGGEILNHYDLTGRNGYILEIVCKEVQFGYIYIPTILQRDSINETSKVELIHIENIEQVLNLINLLHL